MLKSYLKIIVRNLLRHKVYSLINICGLAVGIACCLLILLYVNDELSYDSFHKNADRIYRINSDLKFGATELALPVAADMMGQILKEDYPQVEEYTRIYSFGGKVLIRKGNEFNEESNFAYVDSTFFKVFTFQTISGSTNNVLDEPNTAVITRSIAEKYFGSIYAVGKSLEIQGGTFYKITAVIEDMPANSHFRFGFLLPMIDASYDRGNFVSLNFHTYLLLKEGVEYKEFEKNFVQYNEKYVFPYAIKYLQIGSKEEFYKAGNRIEHSLIPITDIHLYSKRAQEMSPSGSIQYVYIFSAVAFFILLIACINFMNLTTARSANRAREVGIRKVLGTEPKKLIIQFLTESIVTSVISVCVAIFLVLITLPVFSELSGKDFTISNLASKSFLLFLFLLPLIVGLIAGVYPAVFLSRFTPGEIIKGRKSLGSKSQGLRSALVVFQFTASIILISGTIIIYSQLNYIQNKNLGYQKEQILIINNTYALNNIDAFKNEILKIPGVTSGTVSEFLPTPSARNFSAFYKEAASISQGGMTMQRWKIDYDYLQTLGIKLIAGRNFSPEFGTDSSSVILNETAVKQFGLKDPLNEKLYTWEGGGRVVQYNIVGIVKNFHFESFHQDIGPLCFSLDRSYGLTSFKVNSAGIGNILQKVESVWKSFSTGLPFDYWFMDESFSDMYKAEQRIGKIAISFSILAILVASLGLFGLAAFLAEQRTKEIGVRKVLGASITTIFIMLAKEFIKWIIFANIIALPAAYYFMQGWLQDFAYRINISWWMFTVSGVIALLIALATVSFQAIKAATANPVESLKYE